MMRQTTTLDWVINEIKCKPVLTRWMAEETAEEDLAMMDEVTDVAGRWRLVKWPCMWNGGGSAIGAPHAAMWWWRRRLILLHGLAAMNEAMEVNTELAR